MRCCRYTTLHYTTLHYTTLHYTTLHYTTRHSRPASLRSRSATCTPLEAWILAGKSQPNYYPRSVFSSHKVQVPQWPIHSDRSIYSHAISYRPASLSLKVDFLSHILFKDPAGSKASSPVLMIYSSTPPQCMKQHSTAQHSFLPSSLDEPLALSQSSNRIDFKHVLQPTRKKLLYIFHHLHLYISFPLISQLNRA